MGERLGGLWGEGTGIGMGLENEERGEQYGTKNLHGEESSSGIAVFIRARGARFEEIEFDFG